MPRKSEKMKIDNPKLDKRIKILPSQYEQVKEDYIKLKSLRKVALKYGVDKATISKIVNPNQAERMRQQAIKSSIELRERIKRDDEYRLKRNESMRKHRKYKDDLYKQGKLKEGE